MVFVHDAPSSILLAEPHGEAKFEVDGVLGPAGTAWSLPACPLLNGFKNTLTLFDTCSISFIEHVQKTLNPLDCSLPWGVVEVSRAAEICPGGKSCYTC